MGRHPDDAEGSSGLGPSGCDGSAAERRRAEIASQFPDETELPEADEEALTTGLPRRVESWRRRSATGAILTGFAFGLREVLEAERNEPAVVLQTSGAPPRDLPVEADLEDPLPKHNVVRVRPWLIEDANGEGGGAGGGAGGGGGGGAEGSARPATTIPSRERRRRSGRKER